MIKKTYIPNKPRSRKLIGASMLQSSVGSSIGGSTTTHTHTNKAVIDQLTQPDIDLLSYLSLYQTGVEMEVLLDEFGDPVLDVNGDPVMVEKRVPVLDEFGNPVLDEFGDPVTETIPVFAIKSTATFFSEKEVSAYGLGDEGSGGGGGFDMLLAWDNYSSEKSQWVISAALGKGLMDRIVLLEDGGSGGSNVTWGTESGGYIPLTVEGVSKSVALSTHTHSQYALTTHNHSGVYEPVFSKNTAFNKDFGTTSTTVARGNHTHSGVYEPVFSKNTAFNKAFGTTSGTVAQGNDSRIVNGQTAYGWGNHASAGYAPVSHDHSGVYEPVFSKNTAFNKAFGTTSGTVAQGDDSRIENGQTAYGWGDHSSAGYSLSTHTHTIAQITGLQGVLEDTEREILESQGYMKARYVRDWIQGSSANNYNNWTELKVVNKAGVNLALGKIPTHNGTFDNPSGNPLSKLTDNDTTTASYTYLRITTPASLNYMQIDLGEVYYDIDFIHIWHYPDGRVYNNAKTEISEDGITWKTIFDSAVSGTYVETEGGKIHTHKGLDDKLNLIGGTLSGNLTAPTFIGALTGNASTATTLETARTIWGQSFNGSANVTGALTGATTIAASTSVTTPKVIFAAAGWSLEQTGTELQMKYNGTAKMRFLSGGSIVATQEITAYS